MQSIPPTNLPLWQTGYHVQPGEPTEALPVALSAFVTTEPPSLTAVVPQ